ncbi:MAG TPA: transporter substrate-binding domain-containing protein, partial [Propionibacteriaceae bacterium]
MNARIRISLATASVAALALAGCSSDSSSDTPKGPTPPAASVSRSSALADQLPPKVASAGTIVIGTDASYAPNAFLARDGKTVQGMDVDLFNAVAKKFGVRTDWQPADVTSIIAGVKGKKYDIGISSFTINDDLKQQATMVSYFSAGTQWATAKGNPEGVDIDKPCGKNIAVQTGTVQE